MLTDPDLVHFEPPEPPLAGWSSLRTFHRNFIETFPRATYEQKTTRLTTRLSDTLFVCDPELIQDMLVERAELFERDVMTRRAFAPILGEASVFLTEGADWRRQRRVVAPTFRHEALLSFVPVFAETAARQVMRWHDAPKHVPFDVSAGMTHITFDVIVETMLGGAANLDVEAYVRALAVASDVSQWHSLLAMFSIPDWMPFPGRRRARRASAYLHQEMGRIVSARRAQPAARLDLLNLLLEARDPETGHGMTDAELVGNVLTFVNAGHETTAVALTWTLWLVARDGAIQARLYDEVKAVAGQQAIAPMHIERLTLCRQVLQEAMRLYPPGAVLVRQAKGETMLGEHRLKPSTLIVVPIFALHRHLQLWENPDTFAPQRFASDQVKARPRCAYLPFGAGPRTCIGAGFAMLEATVVLATLVRAFRLRPAPNHKPKPVARVTLRAQGGLPLLIEPR